MQARLRVGVSGSSVPVKNPITVVAKDSNDRELGRGSFTLYAFEDSTIGKVVLERTKEQGYDKVGDPKGNTPFLGHSHSAADRKNGTVFAYADSAFLAGSWARGMVYVDTPSWREDGEVSVQAIMKVTSVSISVSGLGGSRGKAVARLEVGGKSHEEMVDQSESVNVPIPQISKIYNLIIEGVEAAEQLWDVANRLKEMTGGYKERAVSWKVGTLQTYTNHEIGAGVAATSDGLLVSGNITVIAGYVDAIRVWKGTVPIVELKFEERQGGIVRDTSSGYNGTVNGAFRVSGLHGGALEFNGSANVGLAIPKRPGSIETCAFEVWIRPGGRRDATLIKGDATATYYKGGPFLPQARAEVMGF